MDRLIVVATSGVATTSDHPDTCMGVKNKVYVVRDLWETAMSQRTVHCNGNPANTMNLCG